MQNAVAQTAHVIEGHTVLLVIERHASRDVWPHAFADTTAGDMLPGLIALLLSIFPLSRPLSLLRDGRTLIGHCANDAFLT
ncbi:uncharacterized protein CMC5_079780 [Chondromyces crocatus]|uniref:Uncharacterized protein n=1 Tax=Chondromyces crocatus TaxID=52 RepID=A0A0K1ESX3_CHOCO|nr:uncharacterized protein CMC5_079780 [Chondromyces crocatus]